MRRGQFARHSVQRPNGLAGAGPANDDLASGQLVEVERMGGLPDLQKDIVREVRQVIDRAHSAKLKAAADAVWRGLHPHVLEDPSDVARAGVRIFDRHAGPRAGRNSLLVQVRRRQTQGSAIYCCDLARHSEMIQGIRPVACDVELEDRFAQIALHGVHGHTGHRERVGKLVGRFRDLDEVFEPAQQDVHLSKLRQKARVALVHEQDVVDAVLEHREAVQAEPRCEAPVALRVKP